MCMPPQSKRQKMAFVLPPVPRPIKTIHDMNKDIYTQLVEFVDKLVNNTLQHVYPTDYLMEICQHQTEEMFAASSLKMEGPNEQASGLCAHFRWERMEGDRWNESIDDLKAFIKNRLKASLCDSDESKDMLLSSVVTKASMQITKNVCRMVNQEIRNEAELRFCIGDPILCAICDAWKYRAKLEECVKSQTKFSAALQSASLSAAPSTSTSMAATQLKATPLGLHLQSGVITDQSKADYAVYVIRSEDTGDIISVVIETKHTSNSSINHAVAQVIGYFAAFDVTVQTPLVFILTEYYVQMVFFPFKGAREEPLINAIVLPHIEVFTEDGEPNTELLQLLISLSKSYTFAEYVKIPTGRSKTMSRTVFSAHVQTDSQKMAAMVEENLQLRQKLEQMQMLKRKFEASKARD